MPITLRTFMPEAKEGVIQIQESLCPDEVTIRITQFNGTSAEVRMTEAQFTVFCRLGIPDFFLDNGDRVRFQHSPNDVNQPSQE
jgi:hypothetical protein